MVEQKQWAKAQGGQPLDFMDTPLRDFWGRLKSATVPEPEERQGKLRYRLILQLEEVDVVVTTEAYKFPTAQLSLPWSIYEAGQRKILMDNIARLLGLGKDFEDLADLTIHMQYTPGHESWDGQARAKVEREYWEITEIRDVSSVATDSPEEIALALAVGKTVPEFNAAVMRNPVIKAAGKLGGQPTTVALTNKTDGFLAQALRDGLLVKDQDGRLQLP